MEKCYQEVRLKMVILRNLEVPNILRIVLAYDFEYQPTMLELGSQNNVFKTGTKWLCDIYSIIKTLRLSGKNVERSYHNLIHKQSIWVTICLWNGTFVGAKWKKVKYDWWGWLWGNDETWKDQFSKSIFLSKCNVPD